MTFGEAIEQMEKGRVVARRSWPEFAQNVGICIRDTGASAYLSIAKSGGWFAMWHAAHADRLARDWEVIEADRPSPAAKDGGADV